MRTDLGGHTGAHRHARPIDDLDRELLRLLRVNARTSQEQLSASVHLSRPAVHNRIRRLEDLGVIRRYCTEVDWDALGLPTSAFLWVSVAANPDPATVVREILALGHQTAVIETCHRVTGPWSIVAEVHTTSPVAVEELSDQIRHLRGVERTMVEVVLCTMSRRDADIA